MDIKLPLPNLPTSAVAILKDSGLNLQLNQVIEAKIIDNQISLDTLTVQVGDKTLSVQSPQPLPLPPGQSLQLQVMKLQPTVEFKLVPSPALPPQNPTASSPSATPMAGQSPEALILKLVPRPVLSSTNTTPALSLEQLVKGQQLQAAVVKIVDSKITLQILTSPANSQNQVVNTPLPTNPGPNSNPLLMTLDLKQLLPAAQNDLSKNLPATTALPEPQASSTQTAALNVKQGATITLQVVKPGQAPTFSVSASAPSDDEIVVEAFKQLLPIQAPPADVVNQLKQVLLNVKNDASVSETLQHLAREILRAVPQRSQLIEPEQLQRSIDRSGLFLESKLAELLSGKTDITLQDDLKLKLGKLVQLLGRELITDNDPDSKPPINNEVLKELLQKSHGALARLTLDQLASLPKDETPKQGWILELPFFDNGSADSVYIEIEQDQGAAGEDRQKNWAVSITITPPDLATIHCKISCYDGSVNTRFWSEAADTVEKINTHLDYLKQQLEEKGLTTGFMDAHQGKPAVSDAAKKPPANLLSEKV